MVFHRKGVKLTEDSPRSLRPREVKYGSTQVPNGRRSLVKLFRVRPLSLAILIDDWDFRWCGVGIDLARSCCKTSSV